MKQGKIVSIQGMKDHPVTGGITCELILNYQPFSIHIVEVSSRRGCKRLPAQLTNKHPTRTLFVPWQYGSELGIGEGKMLNILTNNVYDIHSKQPEYRFSAVKILEI